MGPYHNPRGLESIFHHYFLTPESFFIYLTDGEGNSPVNTQITGKCYVLSFMF